MSKSQLFGLLLWRTGLLIVGSYGLFRGARFAWDYVDLPPLMDWGLSLATTGALLVATSFIAERIVDGRAEGDLLE